MESNPSDIELDTKIADELRAVCRAQPIRPFVLHLADGRSIRVEHQQFILVTPTGGTIALAQPDDTMHIVDVKDVTDVRRQPRRPPDKRRG